MSKPYPDCCECPCVFPTVPMWLFPHPVIKASFSGPAGCCLDGVEVSLDWAMTEQIWSGENEDACDVGVFVQVACDVCKHAYVFDVAFYGGGTCHGEGVLEKVSCSDPFRLEGDFVPEFAGDPEGECCDSQTVHIIVTEV